MVHWNLVDMQTKHPPVEPEILAAMKTKGDKKRIQTLTKDIGSFNTKAMVDHLKKYKRYKQIKLKVPYIAQIHLPYGILCPNNDLMEIINIHEREIKQHIINYLQIYPSKFSSTESEPHVLPSTVSTRVVDINDQRFLMRSDGEYTSLNGGVNSFDPMVMKKIAKTLTFKHVPSNDKFNDVNFE